MGTVMFNVDAIGKLAPPGTLAAPVQCSHRNGYVFVKITGMRVGNTLQVRADQQSVDFIEHGWVSDGETRLWMPR